MTDPSTSAPQDPLLTLREYRDLAPWSLKDLAALSGAMLDCSGVTPINAAAASLPTERTIRYYVAKRLVSAPNGKGNTAVYTYRHLLQVLFVKLRQMEGATLDAIGGELASETGDVLERRVASALGSGVPRPVTLPLDPSQRPPSGRSGQVLARPAPTENAPTSSATEWKRIEVRSGVEVHVSTADPLYELISHRPELLRESVLLVLNRLSGMD